MEPVEHCRTHTDPRTQAPPATSPENQARGLLPNSATTTQALLSAERQIVAFRVPQGNPRSKEPGESTHKVEWLISRAKSDKKDLASNRYRESKERKCGPGDEK